MESGATLNTRPAQHNGVVLKWIVRDRNIARNLVSPRAEVGPIHLKSILRAYIEGGADGREVGNGKHEWDVLLRRDMFHTILDTYKQGSLLPTKGSSP